MGQWLYLVKTVQTSGGYKKFGWSLILDDWLNKLTWNKFIPFEFAFILPNMDYNMHMGHSGVYSKKLEEYGLVNC